MNHLRCAKCGCKISEGDLPYRIIVEILEDYDNSLLGLQEESSGQVDRILCQLGRLEEQGYEEEGYEEEGYEEISFILCRECKDCFSKDPLGSKNKFIALKARSSHLLH